MISVSVAVLQIENNLCLAIIELILICTFYHNKNIIPQVNGKGLYPKFYNGVYKSSKRKKIRFTSNQYLCLFPNEFRRNSNLLHVS